MVPAIIALGAVVREVRAQTNPVEPAPGYVRFEDDELIQAAFERPKTWIATTGKGLLLPHAQVRFRGPRNNEDTYTAFLSVRRVPVQPDAGYATAATAAKQYLDHLPPGAALESRVARMVGPVSGELIVYALPIPPQHRHGLKPMKIPVRTWIVFVQRRNDIYEVTFSADTRDASRHEAAFHRLLETFEFRNVAEQVEPET